MYENQRMVGNTFSIRLCAGPMSILKDLFATVNDYLTVVANGEIKKKGDCSSDFELHKNDLPQ